MVAWILGILALPGVGMLAYWLFASDRLRRKDGRRRRRVAHLLHQLKGRVEQHARTAGDWTPTPLPADLAAIAELGRRLALESPEERPAINSPADAAALVAYEMSALEQEHLRVILLDTRNRVVEIAEIYKGSVNSSQIHVGEIFKAAIRRNAPALIVVHNHPSGDPTPSPDDVAVTRAIVQAGKLLDVDVLDHMVIGQGRWVSLKERGLGFA